MREDEIASLPTEEERRREVRSTVSVHLVRFDMIRCNPCTMMTSMDAAYQQ